MEKPQPLELELKDAASGEVARVTIEYGNFHRAGSWGHYFPATYQFEGDPRPYHFPSASMSYHMLNQRMMETPLDEVTLALELLNAAENVRARLGKGEDLRGAAKEEQVVARHWEIAPELLA